MNTLMYLLNCTARKYLDVLADVLLRLGGLETHVAHHRLGVVPFSIVGEKDRKIEAQKQIIKTTKAGERVLSLAAAIQIMKRMAGE